MSSRSRPDDLEVDAIRTGQAPAQFAGRDRLPRTLRNSEEGQYETLGGSQDTPGLVPRPGMVCMSPRRGYRKPAPADSLTERIGTTNPETKKKFQE